MMGSPTVFIGGVPAARLLDPTQHGGRIVFGAVTVFPGQRYFGLLVGVKRLRGNTRLMQGRLEVTK